MDVGNAYCLKIAGLTIAVETDQRHAVGRGFENFLTRCDDPDYRAVFQKAVKLPPFSTQVLHEDNCYRVHPDGKGGYVRTFFDAPRDLEPYALAVRDGRKIRVTYLKKGERCVSQMHNSFFHLGFESLLVREKRLCLHAAAVRTALGGILFSGRSGIGKSTQADLWCRYRGAEMINGDRPILAQSEDGWLAWGSPYAGSSRCHVNESCPVTAIVMLRQAPQCSIRRLNTAEAFRAVWSGLTVNSWDEQQVEDAADLTIELTASVPVFEFACTPEKEAVAYLEKELQTLWNK